MKAVQVENSAVATSRLLRAGWHPIQIKALTILTERIASPKEIAAELNLEAARNANYHIKELERRGLIELDHTEPRRGVIEHFYKAIRPLMVLAGDAKRMSFEERLILSCWIISLINDDLLMAVVTRTIDQRTDRHLTRSPLRLDEEGYADLIEEYRTAFHEIAEIKSESEERLAASSDEGMPCSAMLACFPVPRFW